MVSVTKTLHERLVAIQEKLSVTKTGKGRFGDFANLQDMLGALKPLLSEQKLTLTLSNNMIELAGRTYVEATATVSDGEQRIWANAQAWEGDISRGLDSSQVTGSASTYARKYALAGLFAITDGSKDADSHQDAAPAPKKADMPMMPTRNQLAQLTDVMQMLGIEDDNRGDFFQDAIGKPKPLTKQDFEKTIDFGLTVIADQEKK